MNSDERPVGRGWLRNLPLIVILCVAVAGYLTLRDELSFETLRAHRDALLAFRDENLLGLAALFVLTYVLIVGFSLPGASVASVTGGFLFGLAMGTVLNVISATIGAAAIFTAARWGPGTWVSGRLETSGGRTGRLMARLRENEVSVLFLMRLTPVVPFFLANLLPALVGVKFRNFLLTTALGIIPGALIFTSVGVGLGTVFDRGEMPDFSLLWEPKILLAIAGLCLLAALPIVIRAVREREDP